MNNMMDVLSTIQNDTIEVAIWQVLTILAVSTLCILVRGSKMGLLVVYVFTLHISFSFLQQHFSMVSLYIAGIFAGIILLIGLFETFTER